MRAPNPVLVYDGDCGFCTRTARWVARRLPPGVAVEPWQSLDLPALGLTPEDTDAAAWWVDESGRRHRGHRAAGRALVAAGGFWRVIGWLVLAPPLAWVARPVYWWVARNRHRMPGSTDACRVDEPAGGRPAR